MAKYTPNTTVQPMARGGGNIDEMIAMIQGELQRRRQTEAFQMQKANFQRGVEKDKMDVDAVKALYQPDIDQLDTKIKAGLATDEEMKVRQELVRNQGLGTSYVQGRKVYEDLLGKQEQEAKATRKAEQYQSLYRTHKGWDNDITNMTSTGYEAEEIDRYIRSRKQEASGKGEEKESVKYLYGTVSTGNKDEYGNPLKRVVKIVAVKGKDGVYRDRVSGDEIDIHAHYWLDPTKNDEVKFAIAKGDVRAGRMRDFSKQPVRQKNEFTKKINIQELTKGLK
jgi:hypothetical protein